MITAGMGKQPCLCSLITRMTFQSATTSLYLSLPLHQLQRGPREICLSRTRRKLPILMTKRLCGYMTRRRWPGLRSYSSRKSRDDKKGDMEKKVSTETTVLSERADSQLCQDPAQSTRLNFSDAT